MQQVIQKKHRILRPRKCFGDPAGVETAKVIINPLPTPQSPTPRYG